MLRPEQVCSGRSIAIASPRAGLLQSGEHLGDDAVDVEPVPLVQGGQGAGVQERVGQRDGQDLLVHPGENRCGGDGFEQATGDGVVFQGDREPVGVQLASTVAASNGLMVGVCTTATSTLCASRAFAAASARMVIRPLEMKTTSLPPRSTLALPSSKV